VRVWRKACEEDGVAGSMEAHGRWWGRGGGVDREEGEDAEMRRGKAGGMIGCDGMGSWREGLRGAMPELLGCNWRVDGV